MVYHKKISPTAASRKDRSLYSTNFPTVLGEMRACATERGLCYLGFLDQNKPEPKFHHRHKRFSDPGVSGEHIALAIEEIQRYLCGDLKIFTVRTDAQGTEFQQSVWESLKKIPYGETISYLRQAQMIKRPKAVRAVANANGMNPISIIIPCHRVIGSDGGLTGYGGGLERKKWLLDLEASML